MHNVASDDDGKQRRWWSDDYSDTARAESARGSSVSVELQISMLSGEMIEIKCDASDTVAAVKLKIKAETQIHQGDQRLMLGSLVLTDATLLGDLVSEKQGGEHCQKVAGNKSEGVLGRACLQLILIVERDPRLETEERKLWAYMLQHKRRQQRDQWRDPLRAT